MNDPGIYIGFALMAFLIGVWLYVRREAKVKPNDEWDDDGRWNSGE